MTSQLLMQGLGIPAGFLRETVWLVLLSAVIACSAEATATPVPTPAPAPMSIGGTAATARPTAVPEATGTPAPDIRAQPDDGARALAGYWKPPTDYYGEPVYGGTLRINFEEPMEHANIWGARNRATMMFRGPTGAMLTMKNPYESDGPVIPDLAKSWEIHDKGDGVTFHFRPDTTWHNGEPFVCEDARFSLESMITGEGLTPGAMQRHLSNVVLEEMTCLDDMTMEIKFSGPTPTPLLAFSDIGAPVFRKEWFKEGREEAMFLDVTMCIGPFKWAEGQRVGVDEQSFERNPDYFIPELPYVDELIIFGILDESTQLAAQLAHQTDWHLVRNWEQYRTYVDHDQIISVIRPAPNNYRLWFNYQSPLLTT